MPSPKVFLSHTSTDKPFVDRLASDLERVNVGVWYDKWEIRVGDSLFDKISEGIEENDFLAIILSPRSVQSEWVRREVNAALMRELSERKVIVLPILYETCEIPTLLREKKYADFTKSYDDGFEDLLLATSPQSPSVIRHSKEFRTAQYLISGLASTDDVGTNILNFTQIQKLYPLRASLRAYLGPEERRLLFWSAVAYRRTNPATPPFLAIGTPAWGLTDDATVTEIAQWTLDALPGVLFEEFITHYAWAKRILGINAVDRLGMATLTRHTLETQHVTALEPMSVAARAAFLRGMAEGNREFFDEFFLPYVHGEVPYKAIGIAATAYFREPLSDEFYQAFAGKSEEEALAAFDALVHLGRVGAVELLKRHLPTDYNGVSPAVDHAFFRLGRADFRDALESWLRENPPIHLRTRILVALANAGAPNATRVRDAIRESEGLATGFELLPTLVRLLGNLPNVQAKELLPWVSHKIPAIAEAAVFGLGHIRSQEATAGMQKALESASDTVVSAALEALAGSADSDSDFLIPFRTNPSAKIRASYYRSLAQLQPEHWDEHRAELLQDHPLVRLAAARAIVPRVSQATLLDWLTEESNDLLLRIAADEKLFAPDEFRPSWLAAPNLFDLELARLPVRLTNFDPGYTWLSVAYDIDRTVHELVMEPQAPG